MFQRLFTISIISLLLLLLDFYVFQAVLTVSQNLGAGSRQFITLFYWGFYLATVLTLIFVLLAGRRPSPKTFQGYWISFLFIVFASKLLIILILLVDDGIRLVKFLSLYISGGSTGKTPDVPRNYVLNVIALLMGAVPFTALVYGMVHGGFNYQVKKVTLKFPNLPAGFHGFTLVQISDLHTGSFASEAPLRKAVSIINKLQADLVVFTGDLVNSVADELPPFMDVLGQLHSKMGVYSILGNHDYGDYVRWPSVTAKRENLERLKHMQARMGWRLLINEHVILERNGDRIGLLGVENWGGRAGFPKYGKLNEAYAGTEKLPFKLLLSHDPSHWTGEVLPQYPEIDLMLSGHTHGMQFGLNLPNLKWSPVQYVYRQWAGLYQQGRQYLYVNVGLGFIGYPGRVGFLPEITLFELQRA